MYVLAQREDNPLNTPSASTLRDRVVSEIAAKQNPDPSVNAPSPVTQAMAQFAKKPEMKSPLDDAFKEFALKDTSPVDQALRDFKAAMPVAPPVTATPASPNIPATSHLKTAHAYLRQAEDQMVRDTNYPQAREMLGVITRAAEHVQKAQHKDPLATINAADSKGEMRTLKAEDLAEDILYTEGCLFLLEAKLTPFQSQQEGYRALVKAKSAFEGALKYHDRGSYHYRLAELHKHLGDKDSAIREAHLALEKNPGDVDAIKFIDYSGGDWAPMWRDIPPETPRRPLPLSEISIGVGVVIVLLGFTMPPWEWIGTTIIGGPFIFFGGRSWLAKYEIRKALERAYEQQYKDYAHKQEMTRLSAGSKKHLQDRFEREHGQAP